MAPTVRAALAFVAGTAFLIPSAAALPSSDYVLHEKRHEGGRNSWKRTNRLEPDSIIPLRIGLSQSNMDAGYEKLMAVSSHDSKDYGKHLSADEVHDIFAPAKESVDEVIAWLVGSGINEIDIKRYQNKGWLAIDMPAKQAEDLMSTSFYEHDMTNS